jgi:hypothetical protein
MEKCLIERTKRSRVHGDGPSRRELKVFEKIGTLPKMIVKDLVELTESYQGNDLGGDNYEISKHCNFKQTFNAIDQKYRQILLQSKKQNNNTHTDEYAYSDWAEYTPSSLVKFINDEIGNVYRFRLSVMAPCHTAAQLQTCICHHCAGQTQLTLTRVAGYWRIPVTHH